MTAIFRLEKKPGRSFGCPALLIMIIALFCYVFVPTQASAQMQTRPRVGVAPLQRDPDPRIEAAADSVATTIELALSQLNRYHVRPIPAFRPARAADMIGTLDFVVYGSVRDDAGTIEVELSVWSRADMRATDTITTRIESVLELFDKTDEAAIALLEAFSGEVIRIGTVRFVNTGSPGSFRVVIDGVALPEGTEEAQTLVGTRSVVILQDRMLGEQVISERTITVTERRTAPYEFAIPLITARERAALNAIEEDILDKWDDPAAVTMVEQQFARISQLLSDVSYSTDLTEVRDRYSSLHDEYRATVASGFDDVEIEEAPPAETALPEAPAREPASITRGLAVGMKLGAIIGGNTGSDWDTMLDEIGEEGDVNDPAEVSFSIRTFLEWDLIPSLALQFELGYQNREAMIDFSISESWGSYEFVEKYSLSTIEVATYLKPQVRLGRGELHLLGGPVIAFVIGDLDVEGEETLVFDGMSDSATFTDSIEIDNSVLFGLALGAGGAIPLGPGAIVLDVIYNRFFTRIFDDTDIFPWGVGVLAGYRYRL